MFKFTTFQVSKTWAKIDLLKELQRERKGFLTEDERKQFDEAFDDARIRLFAEKHEILETLKERRTFEELGIPDIWKEQRGCRDADDSNGSDLEEDPVAAIKCDEFFLYGPLSDPVLLQKVLGLSKLPVVRPAVGGNAAYVMQHNPETQSKILIPQKNDCKDWGTGVVYRVNNLAEKRKLHSLLTRDTKFFPVLTVCDDDPEEDSDFALAVVWDGPNMDMSSVKVMA